MATKRPTESQRHALKKALSKAYWEGWDGKARSVDASHHAPCIEAGRRRYTNRVVVPTPTAIAMERQDLVSDYNGSGWLFALTEKGIQTASAELRAAGVDPKSEAAAKRAKEAEAKAKQEEEFQRVIELFDDIGLTPTGKKKRVRVSDVIEERANEGGECCFDLNELEQIGKQL